MEFELPKTEQEIFTLIGPVTVPEQLEYLRFHVVRYRYLLEVVGKHFPQNLTSACNGGDDRNIEARILDIGTGFEVDLLRHFFKTPVDTAGFYHGGWPACEGEKFYELNLNETDNLDKKVDQKYQVIVVAEVVEHTYTAPELFLSKMKNWLQPGGILVIQTPNAVSLPKRLKMLFGIQPFEKIRLNSTNPGHFREYTLSELHQIAVASGFKVLFSSRKNYFSPNGRLLKLLYSSEFFWPPSFRAGITMVLQI